MRILLTSSASFVPPRGGSTRANRIWLELLASHGHTCQVVCGEPPASTATQFDLIRRESANQGFSVDPEAPEWETILPGGIRVFSYRDLTRRRGVLTGHIHSFQPDWVLVSSEDLSHSLLREADDAARGRIVYLAHTPQFFPFGPESWSPDPHATARIRDAAAVVVIGHHMADYVHQHLALRPAVIHPPLYGPGPFANYATFDAGFVLMVNPCAVKGLSLFAAVAAALPGIPFAALPGWGTTAADRATLTALPNVALLDSVRRIEEVLDQTSVLLMPSLWYEGFGLIVMEAMLHGLPVIASDSGGLLEAKRGTGFILPVQPIRQYLPAFDEVHMPRPVVPAQNPAHWVSALQTLRTDRDLYLHESASARDASQAFVNAVDPSAFEHLLAGLMPATSPSLASRLDRLSPAQRAALLAKIKASRPAR